MRPELAGLEIADPPERWAALGFEVVDGHVDLGGVRVSLGVEGKGIVSWTLRGLDGAGDIDGLLTTRQFGANISTTDQNLDRTANSAKRDIDHVVVLSPDFDRTAAALDAAGLRLRRIRDAGGFRQGFRRLGPAILELVESPGAPAGPAAFWGLVVVVADLDALACTLGERLGAVRDAVQPGRRIATLRRSAGLGQALAFMDPER